MCLGCAVREQVFQPGFTLLEVLVALLILSIGVLGLASLQFTGIKSNREVYYRTQAAILAQDIVGRLQANHQGNYLMAASSGDAIRCQTPTGCSGEQLAADDLSLWSAAIEARLPSGEGRVCLDSSPNDGDSADQPACDGGGGIYAVKIWWGGDDNTATPYQRLVLPFTP